MDLNYVQLAASALSGGLAGGCISTISNRLFQLQASRKTFYPKLNNLLTAYIIRTANPEGRYLVRTVGQVPSEENREFVYHRADFIISSIAFSELKEVRALRRRLIENPGGTGEAGAIERIDLMPEYQALSDCLDKVHKKLKL
jgi:hypothetical protein